MLAGIMQGLPLTHGQLTCQSAPLSLPNRPSRRARAWHAGRSRLERQGGCWRDQEMKAAVAYQASKPARVPWHSLGTHRRLQIRPDNTLDLDAVPIVLDRGAAGDVTSKRTHCLQNIGLYYLDPGDRGPRDRHTLVRPRILRLWSDKR